MSLVRTERRGPAALIALDRADKRNALSRPLVAGLTDAVRAALADPSARSIILTGTGAAFCAGMDLSELQETIAEDASREVIWEDANRLSALYEMLYTSPKPTIAAVNGVAVAGGAGLVTVCDLAVAVPAARFGYPEVRRGLVAAMVLPHLLRHVGERAARHLLLTGELIDAEEARRVGLVNEVVPPERLLARADEWAASLAEGGPEALTATKRLLARFTPFALAAAEAAGESAAPRLGDECRAGLRAFFEKRPAPWAG